MNMTSVVKLAVGHQLADIPMIISGIDPCFSCNDRMAVVNNQGWDWAELRKYGIEYYRMRNSEISIPHSTMK
jgi:ech hydrogenase subunit E